jgi:hypothetical protein
MANHQVRNTVQLVSYVARNWKPLYETRKTLQRSPETIAVVIREVERASAERPDLLGRADSRLDVIRIWTTLLVDAARRVRDGQAAGSGE